MKAPGTLAEGKVSTISTDFIRRTVTLRGDFGAEGFEANIKLVLAGTCEDAKELGGWLEELPYFSAKNIRTLVTSSGVLAVTICDGGGKRHRTFRLQAKSQQAAREAASILKDVPYLDKDKDVAFSTSGNAELGGLATESLLATLVCAKAGDQSWLLDVGPSGVTFLGEASHTPAKQVNLLEAAKGGPDEEAIGRLVRKEIRDGAAKELIVRLIKTALVQFTRTLYTRRQFWKAEISGNSEN